MTDETIQTVLALWNEAMSGIDQADDCYLDLAAKPAPTLFMLKETKEIGGLPFYDCRYVPTDQEIIKHVTAFTIEMKQAVKVYQSPEFRKMLDNLLGKSANDKAV